MKKPSLKHIPLLLLCVYLIRSLILNSVTLNDALVFAILSGLTAFYELQLERKAIQDIYKQIEDLSLKDKQQQDIIDALRDVTSTIKVSSAINNLRTR